ENLNGDIIRNALVLNQPTDERKLGVGGCRETHLNLFEPATNQCIEHLQLLGNVHRLSQGLIAIAQIHTTPLRSLLERTVGPPPVRQMNGGKRTVFTNWRIHAHAFSHIFRTCFSSRISWTARSLMILTVRWW